MASSSSSSSSADVQRKYQVFVSFRGEDTRYNFTSHLLKGLKDRGIHVFYDDSLEKGDELAPALLGAIDGSMISVIVFSENYATSSRCLEEVSHIMEYRRSRKQLVVPIFYHVNPSHVRNQTGTFGEGFDRLVERKGTEITDKIQRWRDALKEAGNLSGFPLTGGEPEPKVIEKIVEDIIRKLNLISNSDYEGEGLVGIGHKLEQIKSLLCIGREDVGMIGIWGMGGIGKTTLARAIYNQVLGEFESGHFLANVREELEKHGSDTLRTKILSTLLNEENLRAYSIDLQVTKDRLRSKRVLLVLDDFNDFRQFEELKICKKNFGSGSRIIVTSRDKQVLENGKVDAIYEVKGLNDPEDLQLFCLHAFGQQNHLVDDFRDLSPKFLKYAKGLPIALKVLGSSLCKKERKYWISKLNTLEEHPHKGIFDVLKISFGALETVERNLFLDIACFGYYADQLKSCYGGTTDCKFLVDKCLLTNEMGQYGMHDLLQEMGQTIVRQESDNPGERSRLWKADDVRQVLENNLIVVFPALEHLSIHYLWSLKSIWEGVVPMGSFAALTTLYLHACQELTYVFKSSMLESVSNLKELQIDDCENMKTIISTDHGVSECGSISLTSLTLDDLPELVSIWDGTDQTKLLFENITVYDCPQLKQMTIDSELEQTLKKISGEQDWWEWEENELRSKFEAIFNPIKEGDVHTS